MPKYMSPERDGQPQYRVVVLKLYKQGRFASNAEVKPFDMTWEDPNHGPILYTHMECYGPYDRLREAKAQGTREVKWSHADSTHVIFQICEPAVWTNHSRVQH